MSAAYVVTKDVRHLAAWTRDRGDDTYARGAYRPICSGQVRDWTSTVYASRHEDQERIDKAMRKPVCRYCAKTLALLTDLGGV